MQHQDEVGVTSKARVWTGRGITVFTVAFLLFDTMVKVLNVPVAVEGTLRLGYPASLVIYIGIVEFVCLAAYLYPRTAVLGAILLEGVSRWSDSHAGESRGSLVYLSCCGRGLGVGGSVSAEWPLTPAFSSTVTECPCSLADRCAVVRSAAYRCGFCRPSER